MSGTEAHSGDGSPTRQPRQSRIHSVGLPARTSLLPEPPPGGSGVPPPIPRRHSATPAVAPPPIPLRPPAIPKRSKNEKPIPILLPTRQDSQTNRRKASDPTPSAGSMLSSSWNHESSNEKLIDLGPFQTQDQRNDQEYSLAFTSKEATSGENDFVIDFDKANFLEGCKLGQKSSFEELQKASRDLEKSLHERIVKSNESNFKDQSAREGRSRQIVNLYDNRPQSKMEKESDAEGCDEATDGKSREKIASLRRVADTKFPSLMRSRGEAEKKFKFEELQAASRKLERRLHEEEDENSRVNKENRANRFEELQRATQDLERRLHSDQKSAEALARGKYEAEMDKARNILQHNLRKERNCEKLEKLPKATQTNLPPPLSAISQSSVPKPMSVRQDSNVSSDSFSQTSSPSYTSKTMEAPLLPHKYGRIPDRALVPEPDSMSGRTIIKSTSTPASLQAIVRVHGNGGSLRHRIIRDTSHYVPGRKLRFRFMQVFFNAVALLIIAGSVAIYLKSYPETVIRLENKTIYTNMITFTEQIPAEGKNPAPGVCLPIIVTFCQYHKIPYNFTVFPNEVGNFGQIDAQHDLQLYYGSVINVGCYELAALFLCSIFVPKCGPSGRVLQPCRSLCFQTNMRCGFFFEMFGLGLPEYMDCESYVEDSNPDECVGHREVQEAIWRSERFVCVSGFQCDKTRCIPVDWRCDGHVDCEDRSDEYECGECITSTSSSVSSNKIVKKPILAKNTVSKSHLHCGNKTCIQASHICDGVKDCPWGQDERYCLRLSERNEDVAEGRLEVYHAEMGKFMSACIPYWNSNTSKTICSMLGYTKVVSSNLKADDMNITEEEPNDKRTLLKEFQECITDQEPYPTVTLTCSDYACGRRKPVYGIGSRAKTRIVGGVEAAPGDWPFLAALLGGPEEIFYCAGVLIADQWVLTASHCVGNLTNITGWTIQLGITRRYSHSYLGQKVKIRKVIPHPKYNVGGAQNNDVALFKLKQRVPFHEHLRPVCLPEPDMELAEGLKCTVIGWGKKNDAFNSEYEPTVNEVEVPVLDSKTCRHWLADKIRTQRTTMSIKMNEEWNITDGMFCAGYEDGGKDACQGDSGGPLLCRDENDDEKWFVGGIVSWGIKCGHPKLPGVYAYVPKYVPWIRSEMAKTSDD